MPIIVLSLKQLTPGQVKCHHVTKVLFVVLNIAVVIMAGVMLFMDNLVYYRTQSNDLEAWAFAYLSFGGYLLQMISGVFILYAIYKIKGVLKKGLKSSQINEKNLTFHGVCFSLYLLGLACDAIFWVNYNVQHGKPEAYITFIKAQAASNAVNLLCQLLLCKILWDLGKPDTSPRPASNRHSKQSIKSTKSKNDSWLSVTTTEAVERETKYQARLWN